MASNEDLVERLLRQSILSLGRETISFRKKLSTEALVVLTIDENPGRKIVISISDVRYKQRMSQENEEDSTNQEMLERLLEKSALSVTQETLMFRHCIKMEGLVTYEVDDHKYYVVKVAYKVKSNNSSTNERPSTGDLRMMGNKKKMEKKKEPRPNTEQKSHATHVYEQDIRKCDMPNCIEEIILGQNDKPTYPTSGVNNISNTKEKIFIYERNSSHVPDGTADPLNNGANNVTNQLATTCAKTENQQKAFVANEMQSSHMEDLQVLPLNYYNEEYYRQKGLKINEESDIHCGKCNYISKNIDSLAFHGSMAHQTSTCLVCQKAFSNKNNLKRHIQRHLEPYFECQLCEKKFHEKADLRKHVWTHANAKQKSPANPPKKLKVPIKTKNVKNKREPCSFTVSKLVNENCAGRECCNKRFVLYKTYMLHMLSHKGNKSMRFQCFFCQLTAATFDSLLQHQRIHFKKSPQGSGIRKGFQQRSTQVHSNTKTLNRLLVSKKPAVTTTNNHKASRPTSNTLQPSIVSSPVPSRTIIGIERDCFEDTVDFSNQNMENESATCGACGCRFMSSKYLEVHLKNHPSHKL